MSSSPTPSLDSREGALLFRISLRPPIQSLLSSGSKTLLLKERRINSGIKCRKSRRGAGPFENNIPLS
jgi:hypothetical protein